MQKDFTSQPVFSILNGALDHEGIFFRTLDMLTDYIKHTVGYSKASSISVKKCKCL